MLQKWAMANIKPIRGNILHDAEGWTEKKRLVMSEDNKETEQFRVIFPPHFLLFLEKRIEGSYTLSVCEWLHRRLLILWHECGMNSLLCPGEAESTKTGILKGAWDIPWMYGQWALYTWFVLLYGVLFLLASLFWRGCCICFNVITIFGLKNLL